MEEDPVSRVLFVYVAVDCLWIQMNLRHIG
ncbi:hypothetical protein PAESOLCIP111_03252 [Paenibacillus solanacearum]|uniref:Uncharacterized protein n=1 Tax=Paenibacillus solanacearum TaxID=2048548 RepID=A0A916K5V6_9BACL|nr:hypothetical protein PAESOLCIP111_03252 [Paenibacillus solanacearum]